MSNIRYQALIKVAELGSISKAAKAIGYAQPSVSQMISSLEKEFGFPLLIREKDRYVPTQNAEKVLYYCHQIIQCENHLKNTIDDINGLASGVLKIGSLDGMLNSFLPEVTERFKNLYPYIELYMYEQNYVEMSESIGQGNIDIAFTLQESPLGYKFYPLFKDPIYLIFKKGHPLEVYDEIPPAQLKNREFVMQMGGFDDVFKIAMDEFNFKPAVSCYIGTGNDRTAIELVSHGLGMYLIPKLYLRYLPENVSARPIKGNPYRTLGYMVKSSEHITPAVSEFLKIAKEYAKEMANDTNV